MNSRNVFQISGAHASVRMSTTRPRDINEYGTESEIKSGHYLRYRANIETIAFRADQRPVHLFRCYIRAK